ncbi:MAG: DNA polymerase III subunit [Anaerolineae bacterium]|jgi:DNA polymerase-3 subunit delta'|nr:DNA polymerase III subunit [Anaerolineae bacterium]MDX9828754.1 DNA polymerase III subunit [Anaerolineae bacterium]
MTWQIVGHEWAVSLLRRRLASGRISHAYLFTGPPQIGKTLLARTLAQALNCPGADPPCGDKDCATCKRIKDETHPDVRIVRGEGAGDSLKIDQVRTLQREAALFPYEGRKRVFILRRMDLASTEAANALLKTLEEPPAHVVLILTAVDVDALPPTVLSRCQRLDLRPLPRGRVEAELRARGLDADQARLLAGLSAGRIGWAFAAGEREGVLLNRRQRDLDSMVRVLPAGRIERLALAQSLGRDPRASRETLELWAAWWRDLLLLSGRGDGPVVNVDRLAELRSLARPERLGQSWAAVRALQNAAAQIEDNVNPRLALEGLLLKLPRWTAEEG